MDKVSVISCRGYNFSKVRDALLATLENLGGLHKYVDKGETVFLKVNLLAKRHPDKAVTTHPVFVAAAADILREYGCPVIIGDSPGGPFNESALKSVYSGCQMDMAAQKSGASLNFNTNALELPNPDGMLLKRITVMEAVKKADKVISLCKFKTHMMETMTGGVKNMFGTVPGALKAEYHLSMPNADVFANALIDICLFTMPCLTLMDAIVGMEGDGPSGGTPRQVGAVIGSASPFALDIAVAKIMNIPPEAVPTIRQSAGRGLVSEPEYAGEAIKAFIIRDFKMPRTAEINPFKRWLPSFLNNAIGNGFQPKVVFNADKCVGCGICCKNCPPHAIRMVDSRPAADLSKCIRCFCCHELCPENAVIIKKPRAERFISRL